MKHIGMLMIGILLIVCFTIRCDAVTLFDHEKSEIESSIDDETKSELSKFGISGIDDITKNGIDSTSVWNYLKELFASYSSGPLAALILLTAVLLLASVAESYTYSLRYTETRDIMGVVVSLFITSIIVSPVTRMIALSSTVIQGASAMMTVYLPVMTGILIFSGHAISSGGYYAAVITVSQVISRLSVTVFTPLLSVFLSLSVCASISSRVRLGGFIEIVSKGFKYGITFLMSVFTAVIGLNGALSGAADSVANKAARFGLSSFIPLIGSSIAEAYGAIQNSVGILRSGAGVFIIIALLLSFAPLITQSILWSVTLWIARSIGEMLSVTSATSMISALSQFLSALRAMLIAVMTVFVIATSIMMSLGGHT
nr:hypothetical protein [uncultured Ruminococcus sp.]